VVVGCALGFLVEFIGFRHWDTALAVAGKWMFISNKPDISSGILSPHLWGMAGTREVYDTPFFD
jgi:hypothetical protein